MNFFVGYKYLVTTDRFFVAPDGLQYQAVFGTVRAIKDTETLWGIKPNRNSANWFLHIGNMVIAGCQIHYAIKCNEPTLYTVEDQRWGENGHHKFVRHSIIYNADEVV